MLKYIYIHNIRIPSYSLIVIVGVSVCNLIAALMTRYDRRKLKDLLTIEIVGGLGSIIGAKLLAIISCFIQGQIRTISIATIDKAGYYYQGGLIGFFTISYIFVRCFNVSVEHAAKTVFLIPLLHSFWKIGCYLAGCCCGILYDGIGAVVFPEGVNILSGVSVFPVQLLESGIAFMNAIFLYFLGRSKAVSVLVGVYLSLYGLERFIIEFLRYHSVPNALFLRCLCSIICFGIGMIICKKVGETLHE